MYHRIEIHWADDADEGSATEATLRATDELMDLTEGMGITVRQDLFCGDDAESV